MKKYSAIITCLTECEVSVDAESVEEAREKILQGDVKTAELYDGGLRMNERFHNINIVDESFGEDTYG